jgi:hypothetical protein
MNSFAWPRKRCAAYVACINVRRHWRISRVDHRGDHQEKARFGGLSLHRIYYDRTLTHHSPDPADPAVTERVITIMPADES